MSQRDEELGRALRDLRAPPHGAGFHDRLHALLEDEAASRGRAARRRRRAAARGDGRRRRGVPRGSRTRLVPALAGAAALAAAIVLVIALVPGGGTDRLGPQPAQAAEVVDRARAALARTRGLRATLVVRERLNAREPLTTERLRVAQTARGDLRLLGGRSGDFYYSVANAREVELDLPYAPGAFVSEGVAPGPPDGLIGDRRLGLQQAAVTRALAAARSGAVREQTVRGRPAYVLRTAIPVNKLGFSGNRLTVVVDRESGFPLAVREELDGVLVRGFELQDLELNPSLPARRFAPRVPSTATVVDEGFRTVDARPVLTPADLPDGYERAETRVAATTPSPTGNEGMNPPSRDVVSTAYRSGLDRIIVSTRRTGEDPGAWQDPIASGEGNRVAPERVALTAGALAGATANVVIDPRVEPHLYLVTEALVVTVTGPLTRDQLLAAANSLTRSG